MRDYGKVAPQFWTGETGKRLRSAGSQVQVVALYLLTCPSSTMLGLYYLPLPTLCHEVGCPLQGARKALRSLSEMGFAFYDETSEFVWVPNMARFQIGESLKQGDHRIVGVTKALQGLKNAPFFNDFLARYQEAFHLNSISPIEAPPKPLPSPFIVPPKPGSGARTEAVDQEHEQKDMPPAVDGEFEMFWNLYPSRNGKKLEKQQALKKYSQLSPADRQLALVAVKNYASSELVVKGVGIRDAHRWICNGKGNEPFRDWITPEQPRTEVTNGKPQLPRVGFETRDYRQDTF